MIRWVQVGRVQEEGVWHEADGLGLTAEEWEAVRHFGPCPTAFQAERPSQLWEPHMVCIDYVDAAAARTDPRSEPYGRASDKLAGCYRRQGSTTT